MRHFHSASLDDEPVTLNQLRQLKLFFRVRMLPPPVENWEVTVAKFRGLRAGG